MSNPVIPSTLHLLRSSLPKSIPKTRTGTRPHRAPMPRRLTLAVAASLALSAAHAFVVPAPSRSCTVVMKAESSSEPRSMGVAALARKLAAPAVLLLSGAFATGLPGTEALAISGGGKDYAEAKIADEDFSGKDFSKKDFSGAFAQRAKFRNSKLQGTRFYKAALKEADFTGADLTGASLEGAALDDAIFTNAIVQSAYFTETLAKVGDITGADFSDSLLDRFVQTKLCAKASGTNPKTGVDTRESLMCE